MEQETHSWGGGRLRRFRNAKVIAAVGLALIGGSSCAARVAGRNPYAQPARMIRLDDGRAMNFICNGRGSPTVLLESGFGAGAAAWGTVQPVLAAKTRVCSYDRAGYGFSDPGPMPRDGEAIARDLDQALRKAGERGPFGMVGHSAGGLYARLFAARRPDEIAGLVLVDTSVPFQDQRISGVFGRNAGGLNGLRQRPATCLRAVKKKLEEALDAAGCLPHDSAQARAIASRPGVWETQLSELDTLFTGTSAQVARTIPNLKETPAIVLTASPTGTAAGRSDPGAILWQALHREVASQFLRGDLRLVKSSHLMMNDRPEVVAGAALELVDAYRKKPAQL